jgi:hypothetical protein
MHQREGRGVQDLQPNYILLHHDRRRSRERALERLYVHAYYVTECGCVFEC